MSRLFYDSIDFVAEFGCLPQVSRSVTRQVDSTTGNTLREVHRIVANGIMIADRAATPVMQDQLAGMIVTLEGMQDDRILFMNDNAGLQFWAYNFPLASRNNHPTPQGIVKVEVDLPYGPNKLVNNAPYTVVWECFVYPCTNIPIPGVATLSFTTTETYDEGGLSTITLSGTMCACEGEDPDEVLERLLENVFNPLVLSKWQAAFPNGQFPDLRPINNSVFVNDPCRTFSYSYGGGNVPTGLDALRIEVTARCRMIQNHVICVITAIYTFRGRYIGSGTTPDLGASIGGGLININLFGGVFGSGGGGSLNFDTVVKEAFDFKGIDVSLFWPPGAGNVKWLTDPEMGFDFQTNKISSSKTFHLNWIHDNDVLEYDENWVINSGQEGWLAHRLTKIRGTVTGRTLPYIQTSGVGGTVITCQVRMMAGNQYDILPDRLTVDGINVWRIEPASHGAQSVPVQQTTRASGTSGLSRRGIFLTTQTQTFGVRDINSSALKTILCGGLRTTLREIRKSGDVDDFGGFKGLP